MRHILFAVLLSMLAGSVCAQSAEDLFQRALATERVDGDLSRAIELYQQVVDNQTATRKLVVQALFQLGRAYERLGYQEARGAYERILNEFSDFESEAGQARVRLASIQQQFEEESVPAITIRQIMSGGREVAIMLKWAALTPDGRHLIYTDWDTGNFELRDLETERVRMLRVKPEAGEPWTGYPEGLVVSADGKWVAYSWDNSDLGEYDLRLTRLDGTQSRILYHDETVAWVYPTQWSTDGRQILTGILRKDQHHDIALISVGSGDVTVLKTLEQGVRPMGIVLSPDGRYVAYSRLVEPGSENWDMFLLPTDGGPEVPLIRHPAEDYVLGWTPDGRYIMFASSRRGPLGVFLQPVSEGERSGEAHMVKADMWRVEPLGFTRDGSFYYTQDTSVQDVYVAEIDFDDGTVVSPPAPLFQSRYEGPNGRPAISPDGKFLASTGERGPEAWWYSRERIISIYSFETGETRQLDLDVDADPFHVFWFASGDSLVVVGRDQEGNDCLYRASATTGQTRLWECRDAGEVGPGILFGVSPDATRIYYTQGHLDGRYILVRDPDAGTEEVLSVVQSRASIVALSADGMHIAFAEYAEPERLMVMPSSGGEPRRIASAPDTKHWIRSVAFHPNGRGLVYSLVGDQLWYAPLNGGSAKPIPLEMETPLWVLRVHPDGRRIIFEYRQQSAELWKMDGFLPDSSSSK